MHQTEDLFGLLRTCHAEGNFGKRRATKLPSSVFLPPKQPVTMTLPFSLNASKSFQRLLNCGIDEAASVHDHKIQSLCRSS